jgi:hypothetical protein
LSTVKAAYCSTIGSTVRTAFDAAHVATVIETDNAAHHPADDAAN